MGPVWTASRDWSTSAFAVAPLRTVEDTRAGRYVTVKSPSSPPCGTHHQGAVRPRTIPQGCWSPAARMAKVPPPQHAVSPEITPWVRECPQTGSEGLLPAYCSQNKGAGSRAVTKVPNDGPPGAHAKDPDPQSGELPTLAIVITAYAYPDPWIGAVPYREISPKSVDHRPVNDRTRPIVHSGVTARLPEVYCHDRRAEGLASRLGRSRRSRTDRAGKRETRRYSPTNAVQALCQHGTLGSASGLGSRLAGMQPTDRLDRRNHRAGMVSWRPFRYRLWWWNCTFGRDLMTADT